MVRAAAISASCFGWLRLNLDRGCDCKYLIDHALAHGYGRAVIEAVLD